MESLVVLLGQYGAISVFFVVLLVQLGLPLPVLPLLLLVGSLAHHHPLLGFTAFALAIMASLLGDFAWYATGRRFGHRTLHLLCRISLSADTCVRQTEVSFNRWGVSTLVIAKFIPGLATLAPPLAGALGLRRASFLVYSALGAALWAGVWLLVGALFSTQIQDILAFMAQFGRFALVLFILLLAGYIAYRGLLRYRLRVFASQARITPHALSELLIQGAAPLILDARSSLAKSLDIQHIAGARPIDPKSIKQTILDIPFETPIVVYCSCPNDVSAIQVARALQKQGYTLAMSLHGGIDAWKEAGFAVEG
jgi:membrane protein DedA with SNARE-associated domain/rhodanese-related sulfurtransferase